MRKEAEALGVGLGMGMGSGNAVSRECGYSLDRIALKFLCWSGRGGRSVDGWVWCGREASDGILDFRGFRLWLVYVVLSIEGLRFGGVDPLELGL